MNNLAGISINCHPREGGDLKLLKKKDTHLRGYDKFGVNRDALPIIIKKLSIIKYE